MKIIANVDFSPQLKKGDSHELPESDAKMLIAMGLARASEEPAHQPEPQRTPRSRAYNRRDMQAADTTV